MTRKCFFLKDAVTPGELVDLTGEVAHHMRDVLRLRVGEEVELRDGRGGAWRGEVVGISAGLVKVRRGKTLALAVESPLHVTLALALSRSDRMDGVVRQATELGVREVVAFPSEHSNYKLKSEQAEKRLQRWEKISREALCQCGRVHLPRIRLVPHLQALMDDVAATGGPRSETVRIVASEGPEGRDLLSLRREAPHCRRIVAALGPEGGWTDAERLGFSLRGWHLVKLGPRVMRFETAATALAAVIQCLWGDMGDRDA